MSPTQARTRFKDTQSSHEIEAWSEEIMAIEQAEWVLTQASTWQGDDGLVRMYCVFHQRQDSSAMSDHHG